MKLCRWGFGRWSRLDNALGNAVPRYGVTVWGIRGLGGTRNPKGRSEVIDFDKLSCDVFVRRGRE